ncbi:TetR/AcrR family transcriptional regulator [Cryptosporangium aurantiacum]|uniref:Transcriptional regulator, TetR family n=1 Tax=Cryptosporangium aurantiacum TaxID=134849 RepID=A0A1M7RKP5_9ACTN|nr:TetR/AcrR family transcriptional regulator [Cryptosporangium aurantiacum]SHN46732.1 transcriptional regulator, TetR family [Cryptosporangium aurantiacum]
MAQRTDRATRRAQIIDVAAGLFTERGYHETSLETLAAAVGIRKASLYYHYPSKDAILLEIHEEMIEHLLGRARERTGSPTERLRGVMRDLVELMELFPGRLQIFFEHYRELPAAERAASTAKRDEYHAILVGILRDGVEAGEFAIDDVELTALSILGSCNWTYQWFRPGGRLSATEVADGFLRVLLGGIGQS